MDNKNTKNVPFFSIITITYNAIECVEDTILSVISQTERALFEYIVIDGQSTDGTTNIINAYQTQIDFFISEKDNGIADAFNKGIKHAQGKFILFLNAGDTLSNENILEKVFHTMSWNNNIDIFYGSAICYLKEMPMFRIKALPKEKFNIIHPFMCHQAMFCKRSLFNKYGSFNSRYKFAMDYDWYLTCILDGVLISPLDIDIVHYLIGGASDKNIIQALQECKQVAISHGLKKSQINLFYHKKIFKARIQNVCNFVGIGALIIKYKSLVKRQYDFIN